MFIEPSVWPPAASQTIPGRISSGPESSRSSSRSAPGVCSRSMWCFTYSGGYCAPIIPEAEYSSSRRFVTTRRHREAVVLAGVVDVVVRVQDPAHVVDRARRARRAAFSSCMLLVDVPVMPSRSMISGWLAPVSTRIGSSAAEDQAAPRLHPRRTPMLRASTRKLDSTIDVDQVEQLDLVGRRHPSRSTSYAPRAAQQVKPRLELAVAFQTIDELEARCAEADYLPDRGLATALYLVARAREAAAARGRGGGREDRGGEGARDGARRRG